MPRFSIVLPTLDRPEFLDRAVQSVLRQTLTDWELIVHNVGGPVTLPDDGRIRYFEGEKRGPAADFQAAVDQATGEVVTPLADDDRLTPYALQVANDTIGDHEWLNGRTVLVDARGYPLAFRGGTWRNLQETLDGQYMLGGAIYWRRSLTDRLGGFNSEFDGAADFDLYLRFAKDQEPVLTQHTLYLYTDHADTDTRRNQARQADATQRIAANV